jgi:hypothetical protein
MQFDDFALDGAGKNISKAERRVADLQKVLVYLAERGLSIELTAGLIQTFEEDLVVSRANLARLTS